MKLITILFLFFGSCLATATPTTDVQAIDAQFNTCGKTAVSTYDMNHCADVALTAADKILNSLYTQITTQLKANPTDYYSTETLNRLVKAERAWIAFRDANCSLEGAQMLSGSGEGPIVGGCLANATIERVKELDSILGSGVQH